MERASIEDRLGELLRRDHARLLAALARRLGDLQLAEDALSDALLAATRQWPKEGIPARPLAWLLTVGLRRGVDRMRRQQRQLDLPDDPQDAIVGQDGVPDDRLQLLFAVCHPVLSPRAQVGLALTALCGLSAPEVARAFLEPRATTARRLSRARQQLRVRGVSFEAPPPSALTERLSAVLATVYLIFNEGYSSSSSSSSSFVKVDLCEEAIRLGGTIAELLPHEPEGIGLWALMRLHHARRAARLDAQGGIVPLDDQDRARWDRVAIHRAQEDLGRALTLRRPGPYQIQAAIAALHGAAERAEDTDWSQIAALYGALLRHSPTPVVELNAAIALAMSKGPSHGLDWIGSLRRRGRLNGWHLLPAAEADLLRRSGRPIEALAAYDEARAQAMHPAERDYLTRRRQTIAEGLPLTAVRAGRRRRRDERAPLVVEPLTDERWSRAAPHLAQRAGRGRPPSDERKIFMLIVAVLTSGRPWREIPAEQAPWRTVFHRFRAWERSGALRRALLAIEAPASVWAGLSGGGSV